MALQALRDPLKLFTDFVVTPASYIVFADGSKYYVKNGLTGAIEYSSTDAAKVIQYAIDMAYEQGGGKVFIKSGRYIVDELTPKEGVSIIGEGGWHSITATRTNLDGDWQPKGTVLVAKTSDSIAFDNPNIHSIEIRDIAVEGFKYGINVGYGSGGIAWDIVLRNLFFHNIKETAVRISNSVLGLIEYVYAIASKRLLEFRVERSDLNAGNYVMTDLFWSWQGASNYGITPPSDAPCVFDGGVTQLNMILVNRLQTIGGGMSPKPKASVYFKGMVSYCTFLALDTEADTEYDVYDADGKVSRCRFDFHWMSASQKVRLANTNVVFFSATGVNLEFVGRGNVVFMPRYDPDRYTAPDDQNLIIALPRDWGTVPTYPDTPSVFLGSKRFNLRRQIDIQGVSPAVGTNNAYGSASEIVPSNTPVQGFEGLINVSGTFATGETVTVKIEAVYTDGSTRYIEKSFAAAGIYELTTYDRALLLQHAKQIDRFRAYAKTNQASTSVTVIVQIHSW